MRSAVLGALPATFLAASALSAQAVLGIGDDAVPVRRGTARLTIGASWERFDEMLDADGNAIGLGAPLTLGTLGSDALAPLRSIETQVRALSGIGDLQLSLGSSVASLDAKVVTTRLGAEYGLTRRLTLRAMVPIVVARVTPQLNVNATGVGGNIAPNPALTNGGLQAANLALFQELATAQTQLAALLATCQGGSTDARCPQVLAQAPTLLAQAVPFASDLQTVYSGGWVPLLGTPADLALRQRLTGIATSYNTLLGSSVVTSGGPAGASVPFTAAGLQSLLGSAQFAYEPITQVTRTGIGDIELGAQLVVLDAMPDDERLRSTARGARLAVGALVRLPTGAPGSPDNLIDVGTGDGQLDVEARAAADVVFGRRLWLSAAGRYGWQLADETILRIAPPDEPFAPLFTRQLASRDLGDYLELELAPRVVLSRYFSVGASYLFRHKAEDRHTGRFDVTDLTGGATTLDASVLDANTEETSHRLTVGIVYSTWAAYREGRTPIPIELAYVHGETLAGSGGRVPKIMTETIRARVYIKLFGPDDRPRRGAPAR
jgi:hypothetical protein